MYKNKLKRYLVNVVELIALQTLKCMSWSSNLILYFFEVIMCESSYFVIFKNKKDKYMTIRWQILGLICQLVP